ncbi:hypothetical protein [Lysinibacillus sp. RC79]|uniref:hypothetical protein n=1 Tax=Lysinibacillus sp. RC79 TaxID=3156296 RepID=UPI0035118021
MTTAPVISASIIVDVEGELYHAVTVNNLTKEILLQPLEEYVSERTNLEIGSQELQEKIALRISQTKERNTFVKAKQLEIERYFVSYK